MDMAVTTRSFSGLRAYGVLAALLGFTVVALGAFGAHALKPHLSPYAQGIYGTAVQYQMFHVLALWFAAMPPVPLSLNWQRWACRAFVCGILLFCGSLYVLALTGAGWLGMITPLGGLAFLAGWIFLALAAWRR